MAIRTSAIRIGNQGTEQPAGRWRSNSTRSRDEKSARRLAGALPAAIVLFTDGVASDSDSDKLSTIAESARRKGVQLHIVGLGSESAAKDLYLYDTLVDEVAFKGDPDHVQSQAAQLWLFRKKIPLRLRKEGDPAVLAQQEIDAPADGETTTVELSYSAPVAGEFDFVLEATDQTDETNRTNNSEVRHVSVREDKIRVLLADGAPRYEFRFLKQLLDRDKSIELSTLLQEADLEYAQEDRTAISHFPVKKEDLSRFDVLILGDLDPTRIGNSALENVREIVDGKGGSVVMIAGSQFNPRAFAGTPLENLLPFEMEGVRIPAEAKMEPFHPRLTLEGQKGTAFSAWEQRSRQFADLERVPEFHLDDRSGQTEAWSARVCGPPLGTGLRQQLARDPDAASNGG